MWLVWIVTLPFAASFCAAFLPSHARTAAALLVALVALGCSVLLAALYPQVTDGGVLRTVLPWASAFGLEITLRLDGNAWLFAMLVTVMSALVVLYARYYMSAQDPVPRFFAFFSAFMGAMLGVVLSGNLIQLALFWELTSLVSFMLIAYWHHRADARRGARMALAVTGAGGLCLFAGVLIIGHIVGSYDFDRVLASGDLIRSHPWYFAALLLIALGALTKSAQFPFHFWLPHAMAAPTPVSALLHSATMVKAGVFLLVQLWPVLSGTEAWLFIVGGAGLCSLVLGAYAAMFQRDMKGVLAYSTVSHLGLITLLIGMNSPSALLAAIFHIVNHATFKAALFMAAGMVDHETGTRDLSRLSGLYRAMPVTATLAVVSAAAMAGVPLLNGFISKEMFFAETVFAANNPVTQIGLPAIAVLAGMFAVAYSLRFIIEVFFGALATTLPRVPREPPIWMLVPSILLVMLCLLVGMLPAQTIGAFLDTAAESVLGADMPSHDLTALPGLNLPMVMSMLAMGGGIALYLALGGYRRRAPGVVPLVYPFDGKRSFEFLLDAAVSAAQRLTAAVSTRRLQAQLMLLIGAAVASAALPLWHSGLPASELPASAADPAFALLWLVGGACAIGAALQAKYHRLAALSLAGGAGLATCLTFAWFSAPDLALTQLAVEVVTVVLILLGLRWLPRRIPSEDRDARSLREHMRARGRRLRDLFIAAAVGSGMAALCYTVLTRKAGDSIAPFFIQNSLPLAGGSNVVNVILVDFRAFDTLGEITVVGIVALTVYALLRRFRPAPESVGLTRQQREPDQRSGNRLLPSSPMMVPAVLVQSLLPIAGLVSLVFLLRGHNAPGGGFVAGLIMSTAIILQYLVSGTLRSESRMRIRPQYLIAFGLLYAAGAGLLALLTMRPFLSALAVRMTVPVLGELHLSSVLLFDLGVYLLVTGATVLILVALAHQSLRARRVSPGAALPPATTRRTRVAAGATSMRSK